MPTQIHRIPGVRGANAWLVASDEGLVLVDTGLPGNGGRIVAFLAALGRAPGDLSAIALTHYDPDHAGSAAAGASAPPPTRRVFAASLIARCSFSNARTSIWRTRSRLMS